MAATPSHERCFNRLSGLPGVVSATTRGFSNLTEHGDFTLLRTFISLGYSLFFSLSLQWIEKAWRLVGCGKLDPDGLGSIEFSISGTRNTAKHVGQAAHSGHRHTCTLHSCLRSRRRYLIFSHIVVSSPLFCAMVPQQAYLILGTSEPRGARKEIPSELCTSITSKRRKGLVLTEQTTAQGTSSRTT